MLASVTGDGFVNIWDMSISTLDPIVSEKRVDPVGSPPLDPRCGAGCLDGVARPSLASYPRLACLLSATCLPLIRHSPLPVIDHLPFIDDGAAVPRVAGAS